MFILFLLGFLLIEDGHSQNVSPYDKYALKFSNSPNIPQPNTYSSTLPKECNYHTDSVVVIEFAQWGFYPNSVYVKEGDRVCFIARSVSPQGSSFRIDSYPIGGSVKNGEERAFTFIARKVGKHKIVCTGTCHESKGEFVVLSKEEYTRMENKLNKERSIESRPRYPIVPGR